MVHPTMYARCTILSTIPASASAQASSRHNDLSDANLVTTRPSAATPVNVPPPPPPPTSAGGFSSPSGVSEASGLERRFRASSVLERRCAEKGASRASRP